MNKLNIVEVIDKDGWRIECPLEKQIISIGQGARNDIILDRERGGGVEGQHLQLLPSSTGAVGYQLVNLSARDLVIDATSGKKLAPRSAIDIPDGQEIKVGDFTLIFRGGHSSGTNARGRTQTQSESIGAAITLPEIDLSPQRPLYGMLVLSNLGDKPGAQFQIVLKGLPEDCYEIEPGPMLFPGAEKEVAFQLEHPRRPKPAAGRHKITFYVSAANAYPGEVKLSKEINILPFYKHTLRLVNPQDD